MPRTSAAKSTRSAINVFGLAPSRYAALKWNPPCAASWPCCRQNKEIIMAIAHEFDYVKPRTLREAVKTLAHYGTRARVLAGGTDLITLIAEDVVTPAVVVDIKGVSGLDKIEFENGVLTIGALVTFSDLRDSTVVAKKFPVIREMTGWVASVGIRNRATMVGNICSAVPCCDSGPILLVYDAAVDR